MKTRPRVVVAGRAEESETKTRAGVRSLALDPVTQDALQEYVRRWEQERELLGQKTQLLFVWPDGRPLHPDTITALFHKHCKAAELPRIRLHDVRHSYATRRAPGRGAGQGDQRAPRARNGRLHLADLRARHPRHGPGRREHRRGPDLGQRRRASRWSRTQIRTRRGRKRPAKRADLGESPGQRW